MPKFDKPPVVEFTANQKSVAEALDAKQEAEAALKECEGDLLEARAELARLQGELVDDQRITKELAEGRKFLAEEGMSKPEDMKENERRDEKDQEHLAALEEEIFKQNELVIQLEGFAQSLRDIIAKLGSAAGKLQALDERDTELMAELHRRAKRTPKN